MVCIKVFLIEIDTQSHQYLHLHKLTKEVKQHLNYVPPTEGEGGGDILLLVQIRSVSESMLLIVCTLFPEPVGGF